MADQHRQPPGVTIARSDLLRSASEAYAHAVADLRLALAAAVAAYDSHDQAAARRALRVVWAANLVADRCHNEMTSLLDS